MPPKRHHELTPPVEQVQRDANSPDDSATHQSGQRATPAEIHTVVMSIADAFTAALAPVLGQLALAVGRLALQEHLQQQPHTSVPQQQSIPVAEQRVTNIPVGDPGRPPRVRAPEPPEFPQDDPTLPAPGQQFLAHGLHTGAYVPLNIPRQSAKRAYLLLQRTYEARPDCFKPRDVHDVHALWHFLPAWDVLPPESQQYVYAHLLIFYVVAMHGWIVAARHTVDPDALFGPQPDPLPETTTARPKPAKKGPVKSTRLSTTADP